MQVYHDVSAPTKSEPHGIGNTWTPATDNDTSPTAGTLTLSGKRCRCSYRLEEFPVQWCGRGFVLFKPDAGSDKTEEQYHVYASKHGPECNSCSCKGSERFNDCKHRQAVRALLSNDWL